MIGIGCLYDTQDRRSATHLALRWRGRVRYLVPRDRGAQQACWSTFRPGLIGLPLRAMASLPRLFGAAGCAEAPALDALRKTLGPPAGLTCCRTGTQGVWSKDTVLFLDGESRPYCVVKAGVGREVGALIENEAVWLQKLRNEITLAESVPALIAHRSGADLCFVAQSVLFGEVPFSLEGPHFTFLKNLREHSLQFKSYGESKLCQTLNTRFRNLSGMLTEVWSNRIEKALRRIEDSLFDARVPLAAAHNDFAPWNTRLRGNRLSVFDWEYAADEQFPLFDPLHFALMPMALKGRASAKIAQTMTETLNLCTQRIGIEQCLHAETQALAYFVNLCTLYLWADRGACTKHPPVVRYGELIDSICRG